MPSLRALLFFSLLTAFLTTAPFLLLRATGKRIDTKHWTIVHTGAVAVGVLPIDTNISLFETEGVVESKRNTALTPTAFFPNLLPKTYTVKAHFPERKLWEKTVLVEEGKTTAFPFARLFSKELPSDSIKLPRAPAGLALHPKTEALIGWDQEGLFGVRLQKGESLEALAALLKGDVENALWVSKESLIVRLRNGFQTVISKPLGTKPILLPLPQGLTNLAPFNEQHFIARTDAGVLLAMTVVPQGFTTQRIAERIRATTTLPETIVAIDEAGILWIIRGSDFSRRQRTIAPLETDLDQLRLVASENGNVVVAIDRRGTAWLLDRESDRFTVIAEGLRDARFSRDGSKLLLIGNHELTLFAVRERLDQPVRPKGSRETIVRVSGQIPEAIFLPPEEEHLALLINAKLYIAELDGRGGRNEITYDDVSHAMTDTTDSSKLFVIRSDGSVTYLLIPLPGLLERLGPQTPS